VVSHDLWKRIRASRSELEAADLQDEFQSEAAEPINRCVPGAMIDVVGTVKSVTVQPQCHSPALEVQLYDGTGSLTLIWLGRRQIAGIQPGRRMAVHGRLTCSTQNPTLFNPRYELKTT
jgi:RecG-like helicase